MAYEISAVLFRLGFNNLWKAPVYKYAPVHALYLYFKALLWHYRLILLCYKFVRSRYKIYVYVYYYAFRAFKKKNYKLRTRKLSYMLCFPKIKYFGVEKKMLGKILLNNKYFSRQSFLSLTLAGWPRTPSNKWIKRLKRGFKLRKQYTEGVQPFWRSLELFSLKNKHTRANWSNTSTQLHTLHFFHTEKIKQTLSVAKYYSRHVKYCGGVFTKKWASQQRLWRSLLKKNIGVVAQPSEDIFQLAKGVNYFAKVQYFWLKFYSYLKQMRALIKADPVKYTFILFSYFKRIDAISAKIQKRAKKTPLLVKGQIMFPIKKVVVKNMGECLFFATKFGYNKTIPSWRTMINLIREKSRRETAVIAANRAQFIRIWLHLNLISRHFNKLQSLFALYFRRFTLEKLVNIKQNLFSYFFLINYAVTFIKKLTKQLQRKNYATVVHNHLALVLSLLEKSVSRVYYKFNGKYKLRVYNKAPKLDYLTFAPGVNRNRHLREFNISDRYSGIVLIDRFRGKFRSLLKSKQPTGLGFSPDLLNNYMIKLQNSYYNTIRKANFFYLSKNYSTLKVFETCKNLTNSSSNSIKSMSAKLLADSESGILAIRSQLQIPPKYEKKFDSKQALAKKLKLVGRVIYKKKKDIFGAISKKAQTFYSPSFWPRSRKVFSHEISRAYIQSSKQNYNLNAQNAMLSVAHTLCYANLCLFYKYFRKVAAFKNASFLYNFLIGVMRLERFYKKRELKSPAAYSSFYANSLTAYQTLRSKNLQRFFIKKNLKNSKLLAPVDFELFYFVNNQFEHADLYSFFSTVKKKKNYPTWIKGVHIRRYQKFLVKKTYAQNLNGQRLFWLDAKEDSRKNMVNDYLAYLKPLLWRRLYFKNWRGQKLKKRVFFKQTGSPKASTRKKLLAAQKHQQISKFKRYSSKIYTDFFLNLCSLRFRPKVSLLAKLVGLKINTLFLLKSSVNYYIKSWKNVYPITARKINKFFGAGYLRMLFFQKRKIAFLKFSQAVPVSYKEPAVKFGLKLVSLITGIFGVLYNFKFRDLAKFNSVVKKTVSRVRETFWFLKYPVAEFFYTTLILAKLLNSALLLNFALHKLFLNTKMHFFLLKYFMILWQTFLPLRRGLRLIVAGKWFGLMRARKKILTHLIARKQTISTYTDYHNSNVITKFGIFSFKLWIVDIPW